MSLADLLMTIYQEHTSGVPSPAPYNVPNVAAEELARLKQKLQETQEENRRLRERSLAMMEGAEGSTGDDVKEKGPLIRAQRDLVSSSVQWQAPDMLCSVYQTWGQLNSRTGNDGQFHNLN